MTNGEKRSESQSGDGYKCSCGFITDTRSKFLLHIGQGVRLHGKGSHKSEGRVNLITGEITMPPYKDRTAAQLAETNFGKRVQKIDDKGKVTTIRTTDILQQATEIKFIPRVFTTTYTPIMHQAQDAAVRWFGWPSNMSFEDFLDTTLFKAFKMWGVELGSYHVDESVMQAAADRLNAMQAQISEANEADEAAKES